ncbi:MAG: conjugal transfer protein TrbD [Pseudomonadota bacterium]
MEELRRVPIHRSLNRPQLLAGADRELAIMSGVISAMFIFSIVQIWAIFAGIIFWIIAFYILRLLAKADPLMRPIFIRYQIYQRYYPAQAKYCGRVREIPIAWQK